jgi:nuclease S1
MTQSEFENGGRRRKEADLGAKNTSASMPRRLRLLRNRSLPLLAPVVLLLACATRALGWGETGHRIVARIAGDHLTDRARATVRLLLHGNPLENVSVFADHYRLIETNTAPWHFVDIPVSANDYDPARDCRRHHGCIVEALEHFEKVLADTHTSLTNRAFALMFVVHLVGDLHQPLHCADNNDRGGNDVSVTLFGEADNDGGAHWNLHSVWDTGLIRHRNLSDAAYARKLSAQLEPGKISELQAGTIIEWALQSHSNAVHFAYEIPASHELGAAYNRKVGRVLDDSLLKGGLRLARVLNEALSQ